MLKVILLTLLIGLIAGFLARAVVPGKDAMGIVPTVVLGIVGSFIGGIVWTLITTGQFALTLGGLLPSIVGAIIALLIYNRIAAARGGAGPTA